MRLHSRPLLALCAAATLVLVGCAQPDGSDTPPPQEPADQVDPEPGDGNDEAPGDGSDGSENGGDEAPSEAVVTLYFANPDRGEDAEQLEVYPVERTVSAPDVLHGALDALLEGPTAEEEAEGYQGWFSAETSGLLTSVEIEDGTAYVDFDATLRDVIPSASSSSGSRLLLAQLDATVTQFPTVDRVVYSLDADAEDFYLWLQMSPPDEWPDE